MTPRRQYAMRRYALASVTWRQKMNSAPRISLPCKHLRNTSSETGDHKTGHISTAPNEGVLYFDNVFPLKLQWLTRIPFLGADAAIPNLMKKVQDSPHSRIDPLKILQTSKAPINVTEVLPRLKEGGAFIKFSHDATASNKDVEAAVRKYLKDADIKPWFNPFQRMRARLVEGRPWVEDLYRMPSSRVKIEFLPSEPGKDVAELTQEQLYAFFRPYGKLVDIIGQPQDSKVFPRYAFIDFSGVRRAIMAKNCLHGYLVNAAEGGGAAGTLLRISYEQKIKAHWIRDWVFSHPRIVLPILAAILATITVAIFEPIRVFSIKTHITRAFHLNNYRIIRWLRAQTTDIISTFQRHREEVKGMTVIWEDRRDMIAQIQSWLLETTETFIIVQGPRGSGKKELVEQALKQRRGKLVIDCKPIQEARGDSNTIGAMAAQVGYRPVFSWANSFSGFIDLAAQSATGMKTGFSETLDTQLDKILNNTATALKQIALESRKKDGLDATLSEDEYLEAHPERRPTVIVDNFLHKSQDSTVVYDKIADWAALLTTANIAHVIFLTHDVSFSKSLSKALPDRVFRGISLSDCSPEAAKRFIISHLEVPEDTGEAKDPATVIDGDSDEDVKLKALSPAQAEKDLEDLDQCMSSIEVLGGRLTDLEFLARRIKSGESPGKAVREIVDQSANEILKIYIYGTEDRKWSPEQAWLLIKRLAKSESGLIRYTEVLLNDMYKSGGEKVLQALEQAELITITSTDGRPATIKPGRPVYWAAFRQLTTDAVLSARLDLAIINDSLKTENATITGAETELRLLGELPKQPAEVMGRVKYLLAKVMASQTKVELLEAEAGKLKKVIQEEY